MSTIPASKRMRVESHQNPDFRPQARRLTKSALLNRPDVRNDSGTKDTAFRGRRKAKRVRVRKLQRQARRVQR